YLQGYSTPYSF
nr:immunoglobulin light chain junction region [Macaca mulatta]